MFKLLISAILVLSLLTSCFKAVDNRAIVMLKGTLGSCTGFELTAPSGKQYTLTASHCDLLLDENHSMHVVTEDGADVQVREIAEDKAADILLLEAVPGLPSFEMASGSYYGERVRVIGHGYAMPLWEVDGYIIGSFDVLGWTETLCSAAVVPGHSGSPVLDPNGNVLGVVSVGGGGIGGFTRLTDLQSFLKGY